MADLTWSAGLERAGIGRPGEAFMEAAGLSVRIAGVAQCVIACHVDPALGAPPAALLDALGAVAGHGLPSAPNTRSGVSVNRDERKASDTDTGDRSEHYTVWLDPSRWLAIGPASQRWLHLAALRDAAAGVTPDALITDASDALAVLDIAGPRAPALMTMACALDIDPAKFAPPRTARALFAGAGSALFYRHGEGFRVHVDVALLAHVHAWLEQAARLLPQCPCDP